MAVKYVEYIQSSGTQYIDTEHIPTVNTRVVTEFEIVEQTAWACIFGTRNANRNNSYLLSVTDSMQFWVEYGNEPNDHIMYTVSLSGKHTVDFNGNTVTLDGVTGSSSNTTLACNYPIYISHLNNGGTAGDISKIRIYPFKIYENGTLVKDLRPALDDNDVACMYDKVNKKYHYNKGTGTFTAGKELAVPAVDFGTVGRLPMRIGQLKQGVPASEIAVGTSVFLTVDGTLTEYIIINQGKPQNSSNYDDTANGTWIVRKDALIQKAYAASYTTNGLQQYDGSDIDTYLENTYAPKIAEIAAIETVNIPVSAWTTSNAWSNSKIARKAFALSAMEVGWSTGLSSAIAGYEGGRCEYFLDGESTDANNKRIKYYNGAAVGWWTRSINGVSSTDRMRRWYMRTSGGRDADPCYGTGYYYVPAHVLKANAKIDDNMKVIVGGASSGGGSSGGGTASEYTLSLTGDMMSAQAWINVGGTLYTKAQTLTLATDTQITVECRSQYGTETASPMIYFNGTAVTTPTASTKCSYTFALTSNTNINFVRNTYSSYPYYYAYITTSSGGSGGSGGGNTPEIPINITGSGDTSHCYAIINGTKYTSAQTVVAKPGDDITLHVYSAGSYSADIQINGTKVLQFSNDEQSYVWTVPSDCAGATIKLYVDSMRGYSNIAITTEQEAL